MACTKSVCRVLAGAMGVAAVLRADGILASDWLQFGYDPQHDGFNSAEQGYSTASGNTILYQASLPHAIDGTPVYLSDVSTPAGTLDLLFAVARDGTLLAINASDGSIVWSKQPPNASYPPLQYTTSTPAIDPNLRYVYAFGLDGNVHKYSVADGTEFLGNGWPQVSTLKVDVEKVESALTIATTHDGSVRLYTVTGSNFDAPGNQGHLTTINLLPTNGTYAQKVFNGQCSDLTIHLVENGTTSGPGQNDCPATSGNGGLWSTSGATYDAGTDRVFISTGNGPFDPFNQQGLGKRWSDSVIALKSDGSSMNGLPADSYTPPSFSMLAYDDADLGISSLVVLPTPAKSRVPHLGVQFGKDGCLRLLNLQDLSGAGSAGHTGGELQAQPLYPPYNACSSGALAGGPRIQAAVWVNPNDLSTWLYIGEQAYQLVFDLQGNPSLVLAWGQSYGSSPTVANGQLYLLSGGLIVLDATTGQTIWSLPASSSPGGIGTTHWAAPIVINGRIYVFDYDALKNTSRLSAIALDGVFKNNLESP